MAITPIRVLRIRYVPVDPVDAERRRRTLLELQVRSILKAAKVIAEDPPGGPDRGGNSDQKQSAAQE